MKNLKTKKNHETTNHQPTDSRIDYVYCTPALYDRVTFADVIWDEYTTPVRTELSNFWRPSDHMPILVDFDMGVDVLKKLKTLIEIDLFRYNRYSLKKNILEQA